MSAVSCYLRATLALLLPVSTLSAQDAPRAVRADSTRPKFGAEMLIPLSSWLVPGPGQYVHDATSTGAGYSGLFVAVGEEAWFRGYLLPLLHQRMRERFWPANATQALIFMGGHFPESAGPAVFLTTWAMWEGWIVRRDDWSVRESIFHHFWFDFAVVAASYVAEERPTKVRLRFPTVAF